MIQSTIIALLSCLVAGFLFFAYRKLVFLANEQYDAWGNVADQQQKLLAGIADVMQLAGKLFDRQKRRDVISATKYLIGLEEMQIAAIADAQQSLVLDLLACLSTVSNQQIDAEDFDRWLACQDEIMSAIDDLYLAQQHYNTITRAFNRWQNHLWVYWMADSLRYRKQPLINIETNQKSYDEYVAFESYVQPLSRD